MCNLWTKILHHAAGVVNWVNDDHLLEMLLGLRQEQVEHSLHLELVINIWI